MSDSLECFPSLLEFNLRIRFHLGSRLVGVSEFYWRNLDNALVRSLRVSNLYLPLRRYASRRLTVEIPFVKSLTVKPSSIIWLSKLNSSLDHQEITRSYVYLYSLDFFSNHVWFQYYSTSFDSLVFCVP